MVCLVSAHRVFCHKVCVFDISEVSEMTGLANRHSFFYSVMIAAVAVDWFAVHLCSRREHFTSDVLIKTLIFSLRFQRRPAVQRRRDPVGAPAKR